MGYREIRMFETLSNEIGEAGAKALIQVLDTTIENKIENMKTFLASKDDITAIKEDFASLRTELTKAIYLTSLGQVVAIVGSAIALARILN